MLKSNSRPQYYVKLHQNSKCARLLPVTVIYVMYVIYYVNLWTSCNIFFGCVTAITVIAFFISYIWYGHAYCNHTAYTHSTISPVWVRVFTVTTALYKKLSCRREAAQCFVFVWSQLQHTAHFVITSYCGFRFTSAKNSIKFCSAVSCCLRRCPTKTPRTNTSNVRGSVGVRTPPRGSDRVRSTG